MARADGAVATAAVRLYAEGRAETARATLEAALTGPAATTPAARRAILQPLLEICLHSRNAACVARYAPAFAEAAGQDLPSEPVLRAERALETLYYLDEARFLSGAAPEVVMAGPGWRRENAYDGDLYLRRQVLASNVLLRRGDRVGVERSLDRILSLVAAATNPQAARFTIAASLSDVLATLLATGQTERAWGLYRASGAAIAQALPAQTPDAAAFRITEAQLLQQVGDAAGARRALDVAITTLRAIELPEAVRQQELAQALTLKAALGAATGDLAAAKAALAEHPFSTLYAVSGRAPASLDEVAYLAARSFTAAAAQSPDPVAVAALEKPPALRAGSADAAAVEIYRAAGLALAVPPGPERRVRLQDLARRLREEASRRDAVGALGRPGVIDSILVGLALSQADTVQTRSDAEAAFVLFQLASRTGASFDADALTALGQARDAPQRRTVHQALRLTARRDRLEREQIQKVTAAMLGPAVTGILNHDVAARRLLRDYDEAVAGAEAQLGRAGVSLRGPHLTSLAKLQSVLAPGEVAVAVAPTFGGLAHMCVRRERTFQAVTPADAQQMRLDAKLLQASLTATYAPSETLDTQFPVAAAVRLHAMLIKPVEPCLRPGDRIVWLGSVAWTGAPLAVLLPTAPPKLGQGYDLSAADWLVRRHAVSYAGSAGAVVALRTGDASPRPDFDFLGVGDPQLAGRTPDGQERSAGLLRSVRGVTRLDSLAELPETRAELEASAQGFGAARVLTRGAATERAVRRELVGDYRYLSFATHGLLRDDLQGLADPALVLTPGASADPADDGLLTASEIADLELGASFVALSACNTANFDFEQMAQDLPALASALAVSGVPATLGTLWPVDSKTGQAVVSGIFTRLREPGVAPADALALAQRAALADPPDRAHLHPRFWAPFVLLGDGGRAAAASKAGALAVRRVEVLTTAGGEVVALIPTSTGVAARFIADRDASGRHGEGLRLAGADGGEAWRRADHDGGAWRGLAELGPTLLAAGYAEGAHGRFAPTLQTYGADGAPLNRWRGDGISRVDTFPLAWAVEDRTTALLAVGELNLRDRPEDGGGQLHVFELGPDLAPKPLFESQAPAGTSLAEATLTPLGDKLLVTYSDTTLRFAPGLTASFDDYDPDNCLRDRITWLEVRDRRTGTLLAAQTLDGVAVAAAVAGPDGTVLLAGSAREACRGQRQAVVIALDTKLRTRTLYRDESLGGSEVRALLRLADGRVVAAADRLDLVDEATTRRKADPQAVLPFGRTLGTELLVLDGPRVVARKTIDAGSDVLPDALTVTPAGELLLGGSLGGEAAIFHLSVGSRGASRLARSGQ